MMLISQCSASKVIRYDWESTLQRKWQYTERRSTNGSSKRRLKSEMPLRIKGITTRRMPLQRHGEGPPALPELDQPLSLDSQEIVRATWRGGRVAEGAPLLREYGSKTPIEGSNPSLSAVCG